MEQHSKKRRLQQSNLATFFTPVENINNNDKTENSSLSDHNNCEDNTADNSSGFFPRHCDVPPSSSVSGSCSNKETPIILQDDDIGYFVDYKRSGGKIQQLTDIDQWKLKLLTAHFIPDEKYEFKASVSYNQNRKFQLQWLFRYNGLVYSKVSEGGYCKFCAIFGGLI